MRASIKRHVLCYAILVTAALLLPLPLSQSGAADNDTNLARGKGTAPFGSGGHGPFVISKINDGRLDTMGMWGTAGQAGSFGGVKLGDAPVTFNTVRFYLFNGRAAFTGWRLEGTDDCDIDEDSSVGTVYDPELIAADADGQFANANTKDLNVVTLTFKPVKYKYVRLVFTSKSAPLGIPELQVFNREENAAPRATVTGQKGLALDNAAGTITVPGPVAVAEIIGKLSKPEGVTVTAYDGAGNKLKDTDLLKNEYRVLARFQTGGNEAPYQTEYRCYSIVDTSAPPPGPKPPKKPRPPLPPKPPMTPASAPDAPKDTANLIIGKKITGSVNTAQAAKYTASGGGDWFMGQHFPQWLCVDFGAETEFDTIAVTAIQVIHFCAQVSNDEAHWRTLVEVDHMRNPWQWNGYFEKTKARYLRIVVLPPSWDVHVRKLTVANLAKPLMDAGGQPVPALKAAAETTVDLSNLPKAAPPEAAPSADKGAAERRPARPQAKP
jgi:hypothetical protein